MKYPKHCGKCGVSLGYADAILDVPSFKITGVKCPKCHTVWRRINGGWKADE